MNASQSVKQKRKPTFLKKVGVAKDEKRLVWQLIAAIKKQNPASTKCMIVASELDCFQGVADVVAGTFNGYRLIPKTSKNTLNLLTFSTARILSALAERRKSHISKLVCSTGLSVRTIRRELSVLQQLGFLRTSTGGKVSVLHVIRPPFKEIEAYEVKTKDWKSGIYQARNYKSFAHKVSVALPLARAALLTKRFPEFRRMRVGLLGICPSGGLKWFLRPRRQSPISGPRSFLASISLLRNNQKSRN